MRRPLFAILLAATLTACESDSNRLERLRAEESLARLQVLAAERKVSETPYVFGCDNNPPPEACARQAEAHRELRAARNRLDLVQRDIDRLLR